MRATMLVCVSVTMISGVLVKTTAHSLRDFGKNRMIIADFITLIANVKLRC